MRVFEVGDKVRYINYGDSPDWADIEGTLTSVASKYVSLKITKPNDTSIFDIGAVIYPNVANLELMEEEPSLPFAVGGTDLIPAEESAVVHPAHYGGDTTYEAIKVIEAWGLGFHLGNTVKYISRAGKKDKHKLLEDLKKALWYLTRKIAKLEEELSTST